MWALVAVMVAQTPCAAAADSGWTAYRRGALEEATRFFARAAAACPGHSGAMVGLGFVALRNNDPAAAQARFDGALAADSNNADAWYGRGLARRRRGDLPGALAAWRRALRIAPDYHDAADALLAAGVDSGVPRPPFTRSPVALVPARTSGERFEIRQEGAWRSFYVKGINLGAALPGKFPAEFPTGDSTYARWLELMAAAHANVVRVYTILPPAFYRALAAWNAAHPDRALWLVHGVWAEPPPRDDYDHPAWKQAFRHEMRRVVDVVHGRGVIAARPGHAFGRYDADVSTHVLAFIIGREWEPFTIKHYNRRRARHTTYAGRFLAVDRGTPADAWMAEQCDYLQTYEWDNYHAARPIAYTNWPTLDPLRHATEPTREEELQIRRRQGLATRTRLKEYDNDGDGLDAMLVRPTAANPAGYFAAFHAYPYYPDFIGLDSAYGTARSSAGASHYSGYLLDLKRHHRGRPVLIAEYGVPSSRGLAHLDADGLHHGGHDEAGMAAVDARLTREIREAGLAGGILFAWLDEWFKHNWVVIDLALPAERTRLWHNVQNAEQHYGLLGQYAGDADRPVPGGDAARWRGGALPLSYGNDSLRLRVGWDPAYLYLAIEDPRAGAAGAAGAARYRIGIDTYRTDRGQFLLPDDLGPSSIGVEFVVVVNDTTDAQLLVARSYNPYLGPRPGMQPTDLDPFYHDAATVDRRQVDGAFDSLFVTTNRFRVARDGRRFAARGVNRGRLQYGRAATASNADWFLDRSEGMLEVRLPWNLLNVTDPSSRTVPRAGLAPRRSATTDR